MCNETPEYLFAESWIADSDSNSVIICNKILGYVGNPALRRAATVRLGIRKIRRLFGALRTDYPGTISEVNRDKLDRSSVRAVPRGPAQRVKEISRDRCGGLELEVSINRFIRPH
jgi:hypothetical protein